MEKFTELNDDPVYIYLKSKVEGDFEIIGGMIEEPKKTAFDEPRKKIHVQVRNKTSKATGTLVYNYNKLAKEVVNA